MNWFDNPKKEEAVEDYSFESRTRNKPVNEESYDFGVPYKKKAKQVKEPVAQESVDREPIEPVEPEKSIEEHREEAWQQGYDEGLKELEARILQLEQQMQQQAEHHLTHMLEQVHDVEQSLVSQVQRMSTTLAKSFARHIVGDALRHSKESVFRVTAAVIESASGLGAFRVCVHPDAVSFLNSRYQELAAIHSDCQLLAIEADETLDYGDCRIIAEGGEVESFTADRIDSLAKMALMQLTVEPVPLRTESSPELVKSSTNDNDISDDANSDWGAVSSG